MRTEFNNNNNPKIRYKQLQKILMTGKLSQKDSNRYKALLVKKALSSPAGRKALAQRMCGGRNK